MSWRNFCFSQYVPTWRSGNEMPWRVGGPGFDFRHIQNYFFFSSFLSFFPFSFSFFSYFPFHCEGCPLPLPLEREIWIISKINARL